MDARQYLTKYGPERAAAVAKAAGTNLAYFKQIAYRARKPGPQLTQRLAEASRNVMRLHDLRPDIYPAPRRRRREGS